MDSKFFLKSWTVIVNLATVLAAALVVALGIPDFAPYYPYIIALQGVVNFVLRFKTVVPVTMTRKSE